MSVYTNNMAYTVHAFSLLEAHIKISESADVKPQTALFTKRVLFRCVGPSIIFRSFYGLQ